MDQSDQNDLENLKSWLDIQNVLIDRAPTQAKQFNKELRDHLIRNGYPEPAPIQRLVLPFLLQEETVERFIYIKSPTGTGKTLSFLLPALFFFDESYLQNFAHSDQGVFQYYPYCLIMANQHPLLRQIRDDFDSIIPLSLKQKGLAIQHFDKRDSEANITGQILCAVPEKICKFIQDDKLQLKNVRYIIIDEADMTVMNDKTHRVKEIVKKLMKCGNLRWKMIICGATINMEQLKSYFTNSLGEEEEAVKIKTFFDFKYFNYEITLDNIFHYIYSASK